jgi:hypothetical protein
LRRLSFGTEKAKHHNVLHNPFLKLGAALLASISLAYPQQIAPKTATPAPVTQDNSTKYTCNQLRMVGNPNLGFMNSQSTGGQSGPAYNVWLRETKDSILFRDSWNVSFSAKGDGSNFRYTKASSMGQKTWNLNFTGPKTFKLRITSATTVFPTVTLETNCHCKDARKAAAAPTDKTMRGVFIRPDKALFQFYTSFGGPGKTAVTVSGTLKSSAQDLLNSGVTDIFIGFKTDFPWSHNGHSGDFLFDSKEGGYEDSLSLFARQNGFDPINAFMNACQATYAAAGKKVRFHAWFPVFKDEYAVRFGFQTGNANSGFVGNALNAISHLLNGKNCDCQSNVAAEPSNPMVVTYELTALEELMANYPLLSGINLDYIRYMLVGDSCYAGGDVKKDVEPHIWNVNSTAIEDFVKKVRAEFPNAVLSADVFADAQMRIDIGQAGILQYLDIIMPMAYTYFPNGTAMDLKTWVSTIKQGFPTKTVMPILRGWEDGLPNPTPAGLISNLTSDLVAVKTIGSDGYAIFTYEYLLKQTGNNKLSAIKAKLGY